MLEGIETGYEERYDFPYRADPPEHAYLLATVPRTGSSFVSHLLWQSGCIGAPLEYLNFVPTGPARFAVDDPEQQAALWRSMLHVRTSPNGVFGLKCFPAQLRTLQQFNPPLLFEVMNLLFRGPGARVVRLRRREGLAHAISYARALTSGIWRKEQEQPSAGTIAYAEGAIDRARQMLDEQEAEWDALFAELGIAPLELWYEDIIGEPEAVVRAVASYIGVERDPAASVSIYQVERQSQKDALRWRARYQTQKKEI